jgi:hypothetical protein
MRRNDVLQFMIFHDDYSHKKISEYDDDDNDDGDSVSSSNTLLTDLFRHNNVMRSDVTSLLNQNTQITPPSACCGRHHISVYRMQIFCGGTRGDEA